MVNLSANKEVTEKLTRDYEQLKALLKTWTKQAMIVKSLDL